MSTSKKDSRNPILEKRLKELAEEYGGNSKLASVVDLPRQTVGAYINGDRLPDCTNLKQIAEKVGVSADWLLGLSDYRTPDIALNFASDYLGLSEESMKRIKSWTTLSSTYSQVLNALINCENGDLLLKELDRMYFSACRLLPEDHFSDCINSGEVSYAEIYRSIKSIMNEDSPQHASLVSIPTILTALEYDASMTFHTLLEELIGSAFAAQSDESFRTSKHDKATDFQGRE